MNEHLEKLFGTTDVPFSERPILEVKITDALPEAFEKVLHYIYTDRIDCKLLLTIFCNLLIFIKKIEFQFRIEQTTKKLCD